MANTDAEKQERQKTVVAFIAGLLIGGLLVWVFSSSAVTAPTEEGALTHDDESTETTEKESAKDVEKMTDSMMEDTATQGSDDIQVTSVQMTAGDGSITVSNQEAGNVVMIDSLLLPTTDGWVVIRDYENGTSGNILGAARYGVDEGLLPSSVKLLRATEAGKSYQAVFFTDNGDRSFNTTTDSEISGIEAVFTAQ